MDVDRAREMLWAAMEREIASWPRGFDPETDIRPDGDDYSNYRGDWVAHAAFDAIAQAHAAGRAEGLREAAEICGTLAETDYADGDAFDAATGCEYAIHKIIRARITTTGVCAG